MSEVWGEGDVGENCLNGGGQEPGNVVNSHIEMCGIPSSFLAMFSNLS
jgi:hypothetical protein